MRAVALLVALVTMGPVAWPGWGPIAESAPDPSPADGAPFPLFTDVSRTGHPVHREVTDAAGLGGFLHAGYLGPGNPVDPPGHFPETMGPGACWLDVDQDGWLDLFLVNGLFLSAPDRNDELHPRSALYRNLGDGTFVEVTDEANAGIVAVSMGCGAADYDNDGWPDLYVTAWGGGRLLHNVAGVFEDVTFEAGASDGQCGDYVCWSTSVSWFDSDLDGCLDLFIDHMTNYTLELRGAGPGHGQKDRLLRGDCVGSFVDVTTAAGLADQSHDTWSSLAADLDGDGWPDLYVCNDGDDSDLYINDRDGTFTHVETVADNNARACMGSAIGDIDHDGRWEIAVTNFMGQMNGIFHAEGDDYVDIGGEAPFTDAWGWVGWADHWYDVNNDGHQDLVLLNSFTDDKGDIIPVAQPVLAYENRGDGTFYSTRLALGPALARDYVGRGAAWADYDDDGDLDFVLAEGGETGTNLLRADLTGGNFLNIDLVATADGVNRDAIGARITVHAPGLPDQFQEKIAGSGYLGSNDPRLHVGLARAESASVDVRWPDGSVESWDDLPANSFVRLTQGDAEADVLKSLPIVRITGPESGRRLETLAFSGEAVAPDGADIVSVVWDFGDGTARGEGASATWAFDDVGGLAARVTATDSEGRTKSQGRGVVVWDELDAEVSLEKAVLFPNERARGDVRVRFSDGAPVRGAQVLITITHSSGDEGVDAVLDQAPTSQRGGLLGGTIELRVTTDAAGRASFEVPFNLVVEPPDDKEFEDLEAVEANRVGAYHVRVEGSARGSLFAPVEADYVVLAALPPAP